MEAFLIKVNLRGFDLLFKTKPGVFSKHAIDEGTRLLIENLEIKPTDHVLDIGCGYGPVGITAAKVASRGRSVLVDANIRAVRLAEENIKLNHIFNAVVKLSDGLEAVAGEKFDVIASNPPINAGLGIFEEFAHDAKRCLKDDGKIYFVTQERLKPAVERLFEKYFGNFDLVTRSRGYIISLALKNR